MGTSDRTLGEVGVALSLRDIRTAESDDPNYADYTGLEFYDTTILFGAAEINRLRSQRGFTLGSPFHDRIDRLCFPKRHTSGVPSFGNEFGLDIHP
jgi:hypothetical protein